MKNIFITASLIITSAVVSRAQNVTIPDANFKAYLVADPIINSNADTEIQVSEATAYTAGMNMNFLGITDFTGIEAFVNLTSLTIVYNPVTTIDLSQNTALTVLDIYSNSFTSLDVSNNTALVELRCENNPIGSLDVSNLPSLSMLTCGNCSLTALDLTNNPLLIHVELANYNANNLNQVSSIDLSNNPLLQIFSIGGNTLTTLDVSNNNSLTWLNCHGNDLTALDISNLTNLEILYAAANELPSLNFSNNLNLETIDISSNPLTGTIDISGHSNIRTFFCSTTNISALNVANGHNSEFTAMYAYENPNLTCIQVDDTVWSNANWNGWTNKDPGTVYSVDCDGLGISEAGQILVNIYPNPVNDVLNLESKAATEIQLMNLLGNVIETHILQQGINSIDATNLTSGIYFIRTGNGADLKFVKQ